MSQHQMPKGAGMSEEKRFDVEFEGTGRATGKMRNDISVRFTTTNEEFELATDGIEKAWSFNF